MKNISVISYQMRVLFVFQNQKNLKIFEKTAKKKNRKEIWPFEKFGVGQKKSESLLTKPQAPLKK